MNFQVLTTLATIGAAILGEWTEALLVVTLVAVAKHMEQEAMDQARAAMQGGWTGFLPRHVESIGSRPPVLGSSRLAP